MAIEEEKAIARYLPRKGEAELASGLCEEYLSFSNRNTSFLLRKWGKI